MKKLCQISALSSLLSTGMCSEYTLPSDHNQWDFKDFVMNAHNQGKQLAIKTIQEGNPNKYIGNPGIINDLNSTPLMQFIDGDKQNESVKWALERGADPNLPQYWKNQPHIKNYPLQLALEYGNINVVKQLLDQGADITFFSLDDTLIAAVDWGTEALECIELMLQKNANPNYKPLYESGDHGKSALESANCSYHWHKEPEKLEQLLALFGKYKR